MKLAKKLLLYSPYIWILAIFIVLSIPDNFNNLVSLFPTVTFFGDKSIEMIMLVILLLSTSLMFTISSKIKISSISKNANEKEKEIDSILQSIEPFIFIINRLGNIINFNNSAKIVCGRALKECKDKPLNNYLTFNNNANNISNILSNISDKHEIDFEETIVVKKTKRKLRAER